MSFLDLLRQKLAALDAAIVELGAGLEALNATVETVKAGMEAPPDMRNTPTMVPQTSFHQMMRAPAYETEPDDAFNPKPGIIPAYKRPDEPTKPNE